MLDPTGNSYVAAFGLALKGLEAMKGMSTKADLDKQAAQLFQIILAGQSGALEESVKQRALLETVRDLEEKLIRVNAWDQQKQRYELVPLWQGAVTYALKKEGSRGEPPHWICGTCYDNGRRSILNDAIHYSASGRGRSFLVLDCPVCKAQVASDSSGGSIERKYAASGFHALRYIATSSTNHALS